MYSLGWVGVYSMLCLRVGGGGEILRMGCACSERKPLPESGLYSSGIMTGRMAAKNGDGEH
jgi:hypothetical protein